MNPRASGFDDAQISFTSHVQTNLTCAGRRTVSKKAAGINRQPFSASVLFPKQSGSPSYLQTVCRSSSILGVALFIGNRCCGAVRGLLDLSNSAFSHRDAAVLIVAELDNYIFI